jgi:DNA/RNA endonuclease YhcR with UshA esterase domain
VGATVEVEGTVKRYEGALEIVPGSPADLSILQEAPPIPLITIQALSQADEGRLVRIIGVLGEPRPFSAGVKVALDDGSGTITVVLWSNVAEGLEPPPAAGQTVDVVGIVHRYRDELEVIPRTPLDWRMAGEP